MSASREHIKDRKGMKWKKVRLSKKERKSIMIDRAMFRYKLSTYTKHKK